MNTISLVLGCNRQAAGSLDRQVRSARICQEGDGIIAPYLVGSRQFHGQAAADVFDAAGDCGIVQGQGAAVKMDVVILGLVGTVIFA